MHRPATWPVTIRNKFLQAQEAFKEGPFMRFSIESCISRPWTYLAASLILTLSAALPLHAQSMTAAADSTEAPAAVIATTDPAATTTVPNNAWHDTVIPDNKQLSCKIKDGTLVVDGLVAKVQLNYEIHHAGYLYFFVPGVGTAIVSRANMYSSTRVKGAINGPKLTFAISGHTFELTSKTPFLAAGGRSDVYVLLDPSTVALDRYPMLGFGSTTRAPYIWPLSGPPSKDMNAHFVTPPPLPPSILPRTAASVAALQNAALTTQPQPKL